MLFLFVMEISYIDRKTGRIEIEKIYGHKYLLWFYGGGRFQNVLVNFLSQIPFFSKFYGYLQKRSSSAKKVVPFIERYGIDTSEFEKTEFSSFNDFFTRKLKPECRPIVRDRFAMPADGRYLVFPSFRQFIVKGKEFSLEEFLQDPAWGRRYSDGSMAIVRLCPTDYHRFHFPCDGVPLAAKLIQGPLFSVSPIALRKRISILSENKRMVTEIETDLYGTLLFVEVGATFVGSIHQTYTPEKPVKKGEEKGYFEFGGSCIVLLFEKGRIKFDPDLVENTQKGFETLAHYGESLGVTIS